MTRTRDQAGVWWTDLPCPACGADGPNQQEDESGLLFECFECGTAYAD